MNQTKFFGACRSAILPANGRRRPGAVVAALIACTWLWACGPDTPIAGLSAGGVHVSGSARFVLVPSTATPPAFKDLSVSLVAWETLTDSNDLTPMGGSASIGTAANACGASASGCSFFWQQTPISGATMGAFALVAPSGSATDWQPVATMVLNSNQLATSKRSNTAATFQNSALSFNASGVAALAALAGMDAETLLARGACLGFVAANRTYSGSGAIPGVSGARVAAADAAPAGVQIIYPATGYLKTQTSGTAADGAVLVVGPPVNASHVGGYAVPLTINASAAGVAWTNVSAVVRPGLITAMPLQPTSAN